MSRGRFASLHSGMLVRAQVANGGFYPVETPTVAGVAVSGDNAPLYRTTKPAAETVTDWSKMAPSRQRRAEVLPPNGVVDQPLPVVQIAVVAPPPPVVAPVAEPKTELAAEPVRTAIPLPVPEPQQQPQQLQDVHWSTAGTMHQGGESLKQSKRRRRAMTLRLEPARHRTLKLASARLDRSCQELMTEAVDDYLAGLGFDWHENGGSA